MKLCYRYIRCFSSKKRKAKMNITNKIVWTDDILIFIIKHVKAAPFVWDQAHPQFAFKAKKAKFWSLLAEKVNTYGGFFAATPITKEALQKKWTNMKTYYLFEESKLRRVGSKAENFSTTWKFRSTLSFLGTSMGTPQRSEQNTPDSRENSTVLAANASESSSELLEDDPLATQDCLSADITIKTEEPSIDDVPTISDNNNAEDDILPPLRIRATEPAILESRAPKYARKSNFFHYGMTIAQDLDQLDEEYKIDAKLEIMQIIAKFKKEQYLNQTSS